MDALGEVVPQVFASLVVCSERAGQSHDLLLSEGLDLGAQGLVKGFPNPELVVKDGNLVVGVFGKRCNDGVSILGRQLSEVNSEVFVYSGVELALRLSLSVVRGVGEGPEEGCDRLRVGTGYILGLNSRKEMLPVLLGWGSSGLLQ